MATQVEYFGETLYSWFSAQVFGASYKREDIEHSLHRHVPKDFFRKAMNHARDLFEADGVYLTHASPANGMTYRLTVNSRDGIDPALHIALIDQGLASTLIRINAFIQRGKAGLSGTDRAVLLMLEDFAGQLQLKKKAFQELVAIRREERESARNPIEENFDDE